MRTTNQCRIELMRLAAAKGELERRAISCKPHEVLMIDLGIEAIDRKMTDVGHDLQILQDNALKVCP